MPAAPAAPAPTSVAPAPAATPKSALAGAPPSDGVINVIPQPVEPAPPPKPGSAKARMFDALHKTASKNPENPKDAPAPAKAPTKAAPAANPADAPAPEETPAAPEGDAPAAPADGAPPAKDAKPDAAKNKVNPWKLMEEYKAKHAEVERQLAETRKLVGDEAKRKAELEKLQAFEKRNKELEDHIRYVDYSKSSEFKEKYQQPYEKAWKDAMAELKEITVEDESGSSRPFTAQDMLELVNMPLPKARELADELFGSFADDIMAQRKEIRSLFDKQVQALEDAKKNGAEREKATQSERERLESEIGNEVKAKWESLNAAITKDEKLGKYFQPIEGDDESNTKLAKGFELVDSAFARSPMDPSLTPEERDIIIQKHVAVRNRAAAFGRLTLMVEKRDARIAELEAELAQYSESTPKTEGTQPPASAPTGGSARGKVFSALHKLAK